MEVRRHEMARSVVFSVDHCSVLCFCYWQCSYSIDVAHMISNVVTLNLTVNIRYDDC